MLKDVLKEISSSRVLDISAIAKNLNITSALVKELISQLERMGYVTEDMGSYTCESKCSSCTVSNCNTIQLKTLSITNKGEKLLKTI
jgi:DNA-binding IclR family transcriptional regulator